MTKTAVIVAALVLGAIFVFVLFGRGSSPAPIVDEACKAGYTRLGEGCVPLKEACEAGGDGYVFDAATEECRRI